MRAASEAGTGIARTLSVALAALLAFSQAPARAEEAPAATESGVVIRKAAVDVANEPVVTPDPSNGAAPTADAPAPSAEPA
ncbi:hypothetical protein MetexDRAFT_1770, partial [Methylorubrum extorquens DSM 13060]